jgi:gamma-glutamylputrescine oxidase
VIEAFRALDGRMDYPPSYYAATANAAPDAPPLAERARADVCIIGGGYTGLSAALYLARAGRKVVLLEQAALGSGASGRNGGQAHMGFRRDQLWLEQRLGLETARAIWQLCLDAHAHFHELLRDEAINCDYRPGLLHLDHRARAVPASHGYAQHMRDQYAYDGERAVSREEARALVASSAYHGGVLSRDGGHLHALNFALGLAHAAQRAGVELHAHSGVTDIAKQDARWRARTASGDVLADTLIVACNGYLRGLVPEIEARVMPINNFIATTAPLENPAALIKQDYAVADSRFVVYYFRVTPDGRLLFGGGENYSYAFPKDIAAVVRGHMLKIFPQLAHVNIDHAWGGTLAVTPSRLPFVRRLQPGLYTAAGYSGQGVMLAPYFGKLLADVVAHESAQFDLLSRLPVPRFPGGTLLRWPILASAMLALRLRDML